MTTFTYVIDARDRLVRVDEAWIRFARENWDPDFTDSSVIGRRLWDFIREETTRHIYQMIVARIRSGDKKEYRIPFRCDSPDRKREMEMVITGGASGEIVFTSLLMNEQKRELTAPHETDSHGDGVSIRMCSWCKKIYDDETDEWITLEEAVRRMRLFHEGSLPSVTHGICDVCRSTLLKTL